MRKKIYVLTAAALITGALMTACASKSEPTEPATEAVTQAPSEEQTDETVTDETAEAGGDTAPEGVLTDEQLHKAYEAVKAAYGDNYIPSMAYDETALNEVFGISPDLYDFFIAEGPMISVHVETFVGVKAKDGKAEDVAAALSGYRESQLDAAAQYPMNMVKLQASQVVTHGDYVFFLMLGAADPAEEEMGEKEALESAEKNNQLAVDAIEGVFKNQ